MESSQTTLRKASLSRLGGRIAALAAVTALAGCAEAFIESYEAGPHLQAVEQPEAAPSGVVYSLPKAHVPMRITRGVRRDEGGLTLSFGEPIVFPDPDHTYTLSYSHDSFSADTVTVQTTPEGLLTMISTTTRDESNTAALGVVKLITQLGKIASPAGPVAGLLAGPSLQSGYREPPKPFSLSLVVDPTAPDFGLVVTDALEKIGVYDVIVERAAVDSAGERRGRAELAAYCRIGACYRRAAPVTVQAFDRSTGVGVTETILLPNEGVVGRVDFQRRSFVENVARAHFESGMLTELYYDDPSEAAAASNSPIAVAESILSIPSAIWQSDASALEAERDLLSAQRSLLDERARLLEAQQNYLLTEQATGGATP